MLNQYLPLVHYVLKHCATFQLGILSLEDYIGFGIEGLHQALKRFNPENGVKFQTYAIKRIRGKMIDESRKLAPSPKNYELNLKFIPVIEDDLSGGFDTPEEIFEKNELKEHLVESIKKLEERERLLVTLFYYENKNMPEIAKILGLSTSRVSQIHSEIIKKLRLNFKAYKKC